MHRPWQGKEVAVLSRAAGRRLQTKPHIRRTPLLLPFALLIGLSACERSPVEFDAQVPPDADAKFAVTDAAAGSSEVEIDSSTYVFARTGDTDIVTFQDTDGRSYEFIARYDSSDQLIQFDLFLDGEYEGIQELRWVQGSHDETVTTSHLGDWAWSDEHHELVMTGGRDCPPHEPGGCQILPESACWSEWGSYGWSSASLIGTVAATGLTVRFPSKPLFGFWAGVLAERTRAWHGTMRDLDHCIRGGGGTEPVDPCDVDPEQCEIQ